MSDAQFFKVVCKFNNVNVNDLSWTKSGEQLLLSKWDTIRQDIVRVGQKLFNSKVVRGLY